MFLVHHKVYYSRYNLHVMLHYVQNLKTFYFIRRQLVHTVYGNTDL